MRFISKRVWLAIFPVLVAVGGTACSRFHAAPSVSPATFLIPGLIHTPTKTTPAERLDVSREPVPQVAAVE
ncbi:MAG: hypothetical protein FJ406_13660 [Verrucomicrobia bacterium]|nr:hypothetical protein [Verrucomicrobiota bacterium]